MCDASCWICCLVKQFVQQVSASMHGQLSNLSHQLGYIFEMCASACVNLLPLLAAS